MIYMIDTANIEEIKDAMEYYPLSGVTTNPTILSKENKDPISLLKEIRTIVGEETMIHAQVISLSTEGMIKDAEYLKENIGGNLYIKIPVTKEGIKAIKILKTKGFNITATAIFTAQQGLMASVAGADYIAPYVNRIDNLSGDGVGVVGCLINMIKEYNLATKVLAASFKNVQQVYEISKLGGHSVTVGKDIFDKLIEHPMTDWSVDNFIKDWEKAFNRKSLI
ncbi:fructose-6-phosphate aldolase [Clostridium sp. ZS1]|uniref:fructose-6-phosphate aldolase n=1 Tax=Clostridium sp. ZS1 TaxID=2949989 RepID=UPI001DD9128F|nr:fructose-6-phosphate aldolase [Clostridium sp. ZS1]MBN1067736.1 fructose-6-phosphate aldolase [Clostridium botulinum]